MLNKVYPELGTITIYLVIKTSYFPSMLLKKSVLSYKIEK